MTILKTKGLIAFLLIFYQFSVTPASAQQLMIDWQKTMGGDKNEIAYASVGTSDGGIIIVGSTNSRNSFDVKDSRAFEGNGGSDMWVVKISAAKTIEWSKTFGGTKDDVATGIVQGLNNDYLIIGTTLSTDGDANYNGVNGGLLFIRLNMKGDVLTKRVIAGGSRFEDPGFQPAGSFSKPTIKLGTAGDLYIGATKSLGSASGKTFDFFLSRLTPFGDTLWEKTYGGSSEDYMNDFVLTSDGGILMVGATLSPARDITGAGKGFYDFLVIKVSSGGAEAWKRAYGGSSYDVLFSAIEIGQTNQYYLAGESSSADGDIGKGLGQKDGVLLKISSTGTVLTKSLLGGTGNDGFMHLMKGKDGKIYSFGTSDSVIGQVKPKGPLTDVWMMVFEESGTINYHKLFGGADIDAARHGFAASDGGIFVAASSRSSDGDNNLNRGQSDIWLMKLQVPPPVVFGKFEAFVNEFQDIQLAWTTTYENNSQTIYLEKSGDNKTFKKIYEVPAAGASSVVKSYGARDQNPVIGQNYYRLRYVDRAAKSYDGKTVNFNFIPLANEPVVQQDYRLYPNPATTFVKITNLNPETEVDLINNYGQKLPFRSSGTPSNDFRLDFNLQPGQYYILIQDKKNPQVRKLVVN